MNLFRKLALAAGTMLVCLFAGCVSAPALAATTDVQLHTPDGAICHFAATSFTSTPPAAFGTFGAGCPGYVAPPTTQPPVVTPPATNPGCAVVDGVAPSTKAQYLGFSLTSIARQAFNVDDIYGFDPAKNLVTQHFPQSTGFVVIQSVTGGKYLASKFVTPATMTKTLAGGFTFATTGMAGTGDMAISTCPGDFTGNGQTYCRVQSMGEGYGISWGSSTSTAPYTCKLLPNTAYYFNARPSNTWCKPNQACSVSVAAKIAAN